MHQNFCEWVRGFELLELESFKLIMDDACALPHDHVCACFFLDVVAQMTIGCPENFFTLCFEMSDDWQRDA